MGLNLKLLFEVFGSLRKKNYLYTMQSEDVKLQQLSIGYRSHKAVKTVAADINADIRQDELTCLLGANGVGKSTLLRTLSAFQPKLGGSIVVGGRDIADYDAKALSRLVSVVLTEKPDVRNMSVRDLVALGRSPYTGFWGTNSAADLRVVDEALQLVGIDRLADRSVDTLSDGERQKVMIAKALAQQTPVIYLDEPTAFLDCPSKVEVLLLLKRICREQHKTIFLSTHDVELALQVADRIWLLDSVAGLTVGTPRELADDGTLSRFVERDGIVFDRQTLTISIMGQP